jgi:hypothetical protein
MQRAGGLLDEGGHPSKIGLAPLARAAEVAAGDSDQAAFKGERPQCGGVVGRRPQRVVLVLPSIGSFEGYRDPLQAEPSQMSLIQRPGLIDERIRREAPWTNHFRDAIRCGDPDGGTIGVTGNEQVVAGVFQGLP